MVKIGTGRKLSEWTVAFPGILVGGGGLQIQLGTEDGENRDLGAVAP
jgi:hypothetical protein